MTTDDAEGVCLPLYRTQASLALATPENHVRELTDWVEHAFVVRGEAVQQEGWESAYKWLRLAQGLRTMTFDMSYEDGGMCAVGDDFDAVWSEMMEEWQLHLVRLGYVRAALEGFVRVLYPHSSQPATAIEEAEHHLSHRADVWPLHAREVAQHLTAHTRDRADGTAVSVASGVAQAIAVHHQVVHGLAGIPEPIHDVDAKVHAAGREAICAAREASTAVMLGIQLLLARALAEGSIAVLNEDKYLFDGRYVPDGAGGSRWVDDEMPYSEYLAVLHLEPGEPPEL
ncbi:hypothetical protein Ssi03_21710 [Sphaerisporangium siamense]|uniref:Uncharacterized protein n=1 Tax=Sphaerisporangium siamense TaxID=795645 RepID=A0A7W7D7V7_9ACTN|nr:hypothetical protein [Sphaerisporangium siamense]MBB4701909.1 hypothetical protein [Sphaerisporangium siamense]GII84181.1 hypothetical protein Ssi03_21710 [Sphaerisporangium siamense]